MGEKQLQTVKQNPPFSWGDLLVYLLLLCGVIYLFARFVFVPRTPLYGFIIYVEDEPVYSYTFEGGGMVKTGREGICEICEQEGEITVLFPNGEYNRLFLDAAARSVCVTDANCSYHKDCTKMKKISSGSGVIVCVPHKLKVVAMGEKGYAGAPSLG